MCGQRVGGGGMNFSSCVILPWGVAHRDRVGVQYLGTGVRRVLI